MTGTGAQSPGTTVFTLDAFGQASATTTTGALPGSVAYVYDAASQGIVKTETISGSSYHDVWHRMGGVNMWHMSNRFDPRSGDADTGGSRYTVKSGDTLQGIATLIWGDGSLWYKLAEANGLSATSTLTGNQQLIIPAGVWRNHQRADTYAPYDAGRFIGNTDPSALYPKPAAGNKKCGVLGAILMVVIAVAVTAVLKVPVTGLFSSTLGMGATAGAIAGGATAAAIGSTASQVFGVAAGMQKEINWKGVGLAAVTAGLAVGLDKGMGALGNVGTGASSSGISKAIGGVGRFLGGDGMVSGLARGALSSGITQGAGVAMGLQDRFDWAGVAAAGIGNAVGSASSQWLAGKGVGGFGNELGSSTADMLSQAAARSIIEGSSFGDNVLASLPSVIGNLLGRQLGQGLKDAFAKKPATAAQSASTGTDGAQTTGQTITQDVQNNAYAQADAMNDEIIVTARRSNPYQSGITISQMNADLDRFVAEYNARQQFLENFAGSRERLESRKTDIRKRLHMAQFPERKLGTEMPAQEEIKLRVSPSGFLDDPKLKALPTTLVDPTMWQSELDGRIADYTAYRNQAIKDGIKFDPYDDDMVMAGFAANQRYIDDLDARVSAQLWQDVKDFGKIYAITAATIAGGYGVSVLAGSSGLTGAASYGALAFGEGTVSAASGSATRHFVFGEDVTAGTVLTDFTIGAALSPLGRLGGGGEYTVTRASQKYIVSNSEMNIGDILSGYHSDSFIHITPSAPQSFSKGIDPHTYFSRLGDVSDMTPTMFRNDLVGPAAGGYSSNADLFVIVGPNSSSSFRALPPEPVNLTGTIEYVSSMRLRPDGFVKIPK